MSEPSYVKEAFLMPPHLIGLSAASVAAMVAFPPLLVAVGVAEALYLRSMSKNPRFQRMVRSRRGR